MKHMQNEWVEIDLVRLMKTTPSNAYHAWLDPDQLRHWFMTSRRTNQIIENDPVEGGITKLSIYVKGNVLKSLARTKH